MAQVFATLSSKALVRPSATGVSANVGRCPTSGLGAEAKERGVDTSFPKLGRDVVMADSLFLVSKRKNIAGCSG